MRIRVTVLGTSYTKLGSCPYSDLYFKMLQKQMVCLQKGESSTLSPSNLLKLVIPYNPSPKGSFQGGSFLKNLVPYFNFYLHLFPNCIATKGRLQSVRVCVCMWACVYTYCYSEIISEHEIKVGFCLT